MFKLGPYIASQTDLSRRKVMALFKEGKIQLNGKTPEQFTAQVDPQKDLIVVDGQALKSQTTLQIYKFHKPWNVISTMTDPNGRRCIGDYIKKAKLPKGIIPVGRLDRYTTGLILLTNDGDFTNKILHPKHKLKKTYKATLDRPLSKRDVEALLAPIQLEDGPMQFTEVLILSDHSVEVSLTEGRNRIVRRAFEALGHNVKKLKRQQIGELHLGEFPAGKIAPLTPKELKLFRHITR